MRAHTHTYTELQWPCWDISDDIETQTKPSQRRAEALWPGRRAARAMEEWTEGMKDSYTEMEVNSKAAVESELVSRQRNAGGEAEGREEGGGVGLKMRT